MNEQVFKMVMDRFDTLDGKMNRCVDYITKQDEKVNGLEKQVERHATYFSLASVGMTPILAWAMYKLGFKG